MIGAGKAGLLFLLAGRMFYMQFIKKDEYRTLSDNNRIKMIVISELLLYLKYRHVSCTIGVNFILLTIIFGN